MHWEIEKEADVVYPTAEVTEASSLAVIRLASTPPL